MMDWINSFAFLKDVIIPVLDVLILAWLIYKGYQILVQTRAVQLVRGTAFLGALYGVAFVFNLRTLLTVLNLMTPGLIIAIAIIFQPELRKIFTRIGQGKFLRFRGGSTGLPVDEILKAAEALSTMRRGALIVFVRSVGLKNLSETGTNLDAEVSSSLLLTIFSFDTPLHDGAVIIENGRMMAAGAVLPLSDQQDMQKTFGTRHRAALGVVEETDAVALVVSEETGAISLAYESMLYYNLERDVLEEKLADLLKTGSESLNAKRQGESSYEA